MVEVEALRFLYIAKSTKHQKSSLCKKPPQILICGDFLADTNQRLLAWLEVAAKLLPSDTVYVFKPHPAYPLDLPNNLEFKLKISEEPLPSLLLKCDIAFTSNITSAAVDAYCLGVPVIQMLNGSEFKTSPLRGLNNVLYVTTPMELAVALCNAKYSKPITKPYFYFGNKLSRWRKLLDINDVDFSI